MIKLSTVRGDMIFFSLFDEKESHKKLDIFFGEYLYRDVASMYGKNSSKSLPNDLKIHKFTTLFKVLKATKTDESTSRLN